MVGMLCIWRSCGVWYWKITFMREIPSSNVWVLRMAVCGLFHPPFLSAHQEAFV